jgi:hypothetical protein
MKIQAQALCQLLSDGGFTRTHGADQEDISHPVERV